VQCSAVQCSAVQCSAVQCSVWPTGSDAWRPAEEPLTTGCRTEEPSMHHITLYTTLHTLHYTLYTLRSTLYALQSTQHSTPHCTVVSRKQSIDRSPPRADREMVLPTVSPSPHTGRGPACCNALCTPPIYDFWMQCHIHLFLKEYKVF
jgi:hypothetical protein